MTSPLPPADKAEIRACEKLVAKALDTNPLVNLLISALRSHGCDIDLPRHVTCETCTGDLAGGFDVAANQVVVCANRCGTVDKVEQILTHEMIHMFDHCTAKVDFGNIFHLACTEVRAANLAHCKFGFSEGQIFGSREDCVKERAARSVALIKGVSSETALKAVEKVFGKCYSDLEPVGRIPYSKQCEYSAYSEHSPFKDHLSQTSKS